jgi:hypothetical protein
MSDNFHIAEKDSSDLSYIYVNNLGGLYGVDVDNTYLQSNANTILTQFLSNHTKSVYTNYRTDNYLGGHHYGDRYVMERGISANNTSKAYIIGNRTDVNGHFMYQIEGVLKLGDNFVDITSPWEGMIWKDPSGNVQVQTIPYGKVTAGETKAFTKGSVAPTSPQEGWVWYDTVNKKFKGWNGTAWAELG